MKNINNKVWQPNSIVYNFGEEPKGAFLIISGTVEFYSKNNVLLGSAGQTEVFGEISCYLNRKHSVTAKAKTHLAAKLIPKTEFSKIIKNAHPVIMGMLRSTYHRLAESNIQREYSHEEIEKYNLMYKNSIENKEEIKNKIDTIKEKLDKKTAQVTEKIISSNEIMMEAVEDSKKVNEELVKFLETSLKEQKNNKSVKNEFSFSDEEINSLFNMQKENIVNIFRNNSRITHNRKLIQDKIVEVDMISKKAQDLVANFHELLYKDE